MAFGMLSRWKPRHLLGAWSAWWAGLAAATLGPAARAVWEVTHLPEGQGSASLAYDEGILTFVTSISGTPSYTGTASLLAVGLWIAGPPLLLWAAWLASRGRPPEVPADALAGAPVVAHGDRSAMQPAPALGVGDPLEERMRRDLASRAEAEERGAEARDRVGSRPPDPDRR